MPGAPRVIFVNGLHRSGTTVTAAAVTDALAATTTTVGVLARHIPPLQTFLESSSVGGADRGVDRLQITAQTPEEYGFLLHYRTRARAIYAHPDGVTLLRTHIAELAAEAPDTVVVLKNPWDLGHEAQILKDFPDAAIIVLRRRLADVEASVANALLRARSSDYATALEADEQGHRRYQRHFGSRWRRPLQLLAYRLMLWRKVNRLADGVGRLPLDRVALLSYDELRADPEAGAAWAAHLLDPHALANAFRQHLFAERGVHTSASVVQRALDSRWRGSWATARQAQVRAGIIALSSPSGATEARAQSGPARQ